MTLTLRIDDLTSPEVEALITAHVTEMRGGSPSCCAHALAIEGLRHPDITCWTAWNEGLLYGCGALKALGPDSGEIKSMRTRTPFLRRGVGQAVLEEIIRTARGRGYTALFLETGNSALFEPAHALYLRNGFTWCEPFGEYTATEFNVFMRKRL
ncbi:MAG: GNAT family N-acetyltransferase [Gemmatimonadota bacterium]